MCREPAQPWLVRGIEVSSLFLDFPPYYGSFVAIATVAGMEVSDMVITPLPGPHVTPRVPGAGTIHCSRSFDHERVASIQVWRHAGRWP